MLNMLESMQSFWDFHGNTPMKPIALKHYLKRLSMHYANNIAILNTFSVE